MNPFELGQLVRIRKTTSVGIGDEWVNITTDMLLRVIDIDGPIVCVRPCYGEISSFWVMTSEIRHNVTDEELACTPVPYRVEEKAT